MSELGVRRDKAAHTHIGHRLLRSVAYHP